MNLVPLNSGRNPLNVLILGGVTLGPLKVAPQSIILGPPLPLRVMSWLNVPGGGRWVRDPGAVSGRWAEETHRTEWSGLLVELFRWSCFGSVLAQCSGVTPAWRRLTDSESPPAAADLIATSRGG